MLGAHIAETEKSLCTRLCPRRCSARFCLNPIHQWYDSIADDVLRCSCSVAAVLFTAIGISFVAIALHGSLRVPDDLFTDEVEVRSCALSYLPMHLNSRDVCHLLHCNQSRRLVLALVWTNVQNTGASRALAFSTSGSW